MKLNKKINWQKQKDLPVLECYRYMIVRLFAKPYLDKVSGNMR